MLIKPSVLVIGKESAGKSTLVSSLTGRHAYSANFRGSTMACDNYESESFTYVDTPGIQNGLNSEAIRATLSRLSDAERVLLVARARDLTEDLRDLLPLVAGKKGALIATFRE